MLGYRATSNLEDKLAVSVLVRKLKWKYLRFFKYNLTIRRCSPTLQLQLLHTSVLAPIDYLVSLLNIDSETVKKIDRLFRRCGRKIFGLPRNTPVSVVTAVTVINPFIATICRDRERLLRQTADPLCPETSLAFAVLKGMNTEPPARHNALANLSVRWTAARTKISTQQGVDLAPPDLPPHRVPVEVALFGDRVGQHHWLREARIADGLQDVRRNPRAPRGAGPLGPPPGLYKPRPTALHHATDIYFSYSQSHNTAVEVHGRPPMSHHGPSGTSIVALCNLICATVSPVARLQTGDLALQRFPWRPRSVTRPTNDSPEPVRGDSGNGIAGDDNEFSDPEDSSSVDSDNETVQNYNGSESDSEDFQDQNDSDCLSDSGDIVDRESDSETMRHGSATDSVNSPLPTDSENGSTHSSADSVVKDSDKTVLPVVPATTPGSAGNHPPSTPVPLDRSRFMSLERRCCLCDKHFEHPYHFFFECTAGGFPNLRISLLADAPTQFGRIVSAIKSALLTEYEEEADWAGEVTDSLAEVFASDKTAEIHWLVHRLLWAMTWAARDVPTDTTAAHAMGKVFDDTVLSRHALRPLADSWVGWSSKWTRRFGDEWAKLLKLPPLVVALAVPS